MLAWLWVIVPFGYGLYSLIVKIPALVSGWGAGRCPGPVRS